MNDAIILPPGVALGIIAFLLSLLPAGFFLWLWYLRHHERPIKSGTISLAFIAGMLMVWPAFKLEEWAEQIWHIVFPSTAHYFQGAILPLQSLNDILLPAVGTFFVVATIEEGLRYVFMRVWIQKGKSFDQIFDGLLIGVAVGLGFATLENALYFLSLFQTGSYNTLVFVFFLRFMISTLAHISFAGLMGTLIARGVFDLYMPRKYYLWAFFIPWFLHGTFDLLLGINFGLYAVFLLLPPLAVLAFWSGRRDFFAIHRREGKLLIAAEVPQTRDLQVAQKVLSTLDSPWNKYAPWLSRSQTFSKLTKLINNE